MSDRESFARLVEPHRRELHAHCYRMLGSVHDAEDALQETLLRAWRALDRFDGRGSLRAWLYKIATNVCLRWIERRPKLVLPIDYSGPADPHEDPGEPLVESVWVEPYPDDGLDPGERFAGPEARYEQRESVELAFIAALQHLAPRQRAVLILCDVLGFTADEVAGVLDTTRTSVYSALQRAHRTVDERLPEQSQQATLRALGDDRLRRLVADYVAAWERRDIDAVVAMLAEDVVLAMPPRATWYAGRAAAAGFLRRRPLAGRLRFRVIPTRASGQLAFAVYTAEGEARRFERHSLNVLTLRGGEISEMCAFLMPELFDRFGLPASA